MVLLSEAIHLNLSLAVSLFRALSLFLPRLSPGVLGDVHAEMSYADTKCLCVLSACVSLSQVGRELPLSSPRDALTGTEANV